MTGVDSATWQNVIQQVVTQGGNLIRPWFSQLQPLRLEGGLLEIEAPGQQERDYCRKYATRLFTEAAQTATGRLVGVAFAAPPVGGPQDVAEHAGESPPAEPEFPSTALNGEYTFEALVVGPSNRLAHAASLAVSESPGKAYNPLFIHGSVGLGKTHMLQAICRRIAAERPEAQLSFLTCEQFINDFIRSVERGEVNQFRYRYRKADLLAIDDIQFLCDHERTQEEFFHTFNTLYQAQKQIILSCDRSPTEISALEERLISRFNWGLVARIDRPCYETRVAIVRKKARRRGVELPEDVVCFTAGAIEANIRELEGAISKILILSEVTQRPIDMALAEEALGAGRQTPQREVTIEDILKAVTARFGVRLAELQSKRRSRSIAFPRQVCMYLARELTRHSLAEIGGYFGGRDHSTVLHAHGNIEKQRKADPQLQATLEHLRRDLSTGA